MAKKITYKKSGIHGLGIFASQDIKKGEVVCIIKGPRMFKVNRNLKDALSHPDWVGFKKNYWVDPVPPYKYLNHSCKPNTAVKGQKTLIALTNIPKNTEVTVDYSIIEADPRWFMKCGCKLPDCRKIIRSISFLPAKKFKDYLPYISTDFRKVYQQTNNLPSTGTTR